MNVPQAIENLITKLREAKNLYESGEKVDAYDKLEDVVDGLDPIISQVGREEA